MRNRFLIFPFLLLMFIPLIHSAQVKKMSSGGYEYTTVEGDPLNTRIYTLKNGLKVYMTINKNEPRIQTAIAVKAGSKNDPADATGLAHYLEHMLFKGTDQYGSLDYKKEKEQLDKIEALYEVYRKTTDETKRKMLYHQIDSISGVAATYAIANEYDKMLGAIGAKGTNAYTSHEQTVYVNDIPANQLDKWLTIEAERFRAPVLRLFHTELEAVYEEKNISLDDDNRNAFFKMMELAFPKHNYGQQTTIGTIDHLKNPSIQKIKEYYNNYYVPNNMAILLSGDLDPDATIKMIDKKFGGMKTKTVEYYKPPVEEKVNEPMIAEVFGPDAERVYLAYRFPGANTREARIVSIIDMLLANSSAGLIDINLNQQQKVLTAWSFPYLLNDYSLHVLGGMPREGQPLEEIVSLLQEQLQKIKDGEFEEEMIEAVINDLEIQQIESYETNSGRTSAFVESFTGNIPWEDKVNYFNELREITKDDIMEFAQQNYNDNYVVVFKRIGERDVKKVVKPEITPVEVNRETQSPFLKTVTGMPAAEIKPYFLDFGRDVKTASMKGKVPVYYLQNNENRLFTMYYVFDMGKIHDKELGSALSYLQYLGTDEYDAEAISKKFYILGSSFDVYSQTDKVYISLRGLQENFEETVALFDHLIKNAIPDDKALELMVDGQLKSRQNAKKDQRQIKAAATNYALYGEINPNTDILSETELRALKASALTEKLKNLFSYEHRVLYYGPAEMTKVVEGLNQNHELPAQLKPVPAEKSYGYASTDKKKIYFVDHDMVQAEIVWLKKVGEYDPSLAADVRMFNEYYGGGMSSITFQTIRESKALAYSTYSYLRTPPKKAEPYHVIAYVGTQADKIHDAIGSMDELLQEMPKAELLFADAKNAIKNKIETERIIRSDILWEFEEAREMGIDYDIRKTVYDKVPGMEISALEKFHQDMVKGDDYTMVIIGSKDKIDLKSLEKYGKVEVLSLEQIFGY